MIVCASSTVITASAEIDMIAENRASSSLANSRGAAGSGTPPGDGALVRCVEVIAREVSRTLRVVASGGRHGNLVAAPDLPDTARLHRQSSSGAAEMDAARASMWPRAA